MFYLLLGVLSVASLFICCTKVIKISLQSEHSGSSAAQGFLHYKKVDQMSIEQVGSQYKSVPITSQGVFWCVTYLYHYMIAQGLSAFVLLNLVNLFTAILGFFVFSRLLYRQVLAKKAAQFPANDLLLETLYYWEFILSGLVLTQLCIRHIE